MAHKTLTTRQLSAATYGKFGRDGVTIDVKGFLKTSDGQELLREIQKATSGLVSNRSVRKK